MVAAAAGCSGGLWPGRPAVVASGQLLVGRWGMAPKGLEGEASRNGTISAVPGESFTFQMVFNADQTYEQSVETKMALAPVLNRKDSIKGNWRVAEARANTLVIELPEPDLVPKVKVEFQSKDRCIFDQGEGEVFVLTRIK
jgi:hypothetical protein